jgi:N-methylhydantoinase A
LGTLVPDHFLGGKMTLRKERLEPFFAQMAGTLNIGTIELAEGILSVANTAMEKALRVISVERGFDPREFTLLAFGGAGGLHAADLAKLLSIPKVLVPVNPGILSAVGMLMADIVKDYSLTVMLRQHEVTTEHLFTLFHDLETRGKKDLLSEDILGERMRLERFLDMRYEGQSYEIIVPCHGDYVEAFHSLHEKKYGYRNKNKRVEIVNLRLRARGIPEKPELKKSPSSSEAPPKEAYLGSRSAIFEHQAMDTPILGRKGLTPGTRFLGPAIVVEYSSTIVVPPFAAASIDEYGNLVMEIR